MAGIISCSAAFFALGGSACALNAKEPAAPVVDDAVPCCTKLVAAPAAFPAASAAGLGVDPAEAMPASRWRVVHVDVPKLLPAGLAPERGLQVKTILASRSITAAFPEIQSIGGVRADALKWHPNGLALDVMIPNPSSAAGIALGNEIVAFALKNTERFDLQDAIWRGTYYTPNGPQGSGYGHYDHVHITTHGDGYPTGGEVYVQ